MTTEETASTSNGHAPPASVVDMWPTAGELARDLGTSIRTIGRFVSRGRLKRYTATDQTYRYDPGAAREVFAELSEASDAPEHQLAKGELALERTKTVLGGNVDFLKQAHQHLERTHKPAHDAAQLYLQMIREENTALRQRVKELEARSDEQIRLREEMLTEQHVRTLVTEQARRQDERKDKLLQVFSDRMPQLLDAARGLMAASGEKASLAVSFLQSLRPDQTQLLAGMLLSPELEVLTPEQRTIASKLFGVNAPSEQKGDANGATA